MPGRQRGSKQATEPDASRHRELRVWPDNRALASHVSICTTNTPAYFQSSKPSHPPPNHRDFPEDRSFEPHLNGYCQGPLARWRCLRDGDQPKGYVTLACKISMPLRPKQSHRRVVVWDPRASGSHSLLNSSILRYVEFQPSITQNALNAVYTMLSNTDTILAMLFPCVATREATWFTYYAMADHSMDHSTATRVRVWKPGGAAKDLLFGATILRTTEVLLLPIAGSEAILLGTTLQPTGAPSLPMAGFETGRRCLHRRQGAQPPDTKPCRLCWQRGVPYHIQRNDLSPDPCRYPPPGVLVRTFP